MAPKQTESNYPASARPPDDRCVCFVLLVFFSYHLLLCLTLPLSIGSGSCRLLSIDGGTVPPHVGSTRESTIMWCRAVESNTCLGGKTTRRGVRIERGVLIVILFDTNFAVIVCTQQSCRLKMAQWVCAGVCRRFTHPLDNGC